MIKKQKMENNFIHLKAQTLKEEYRPSYPIKNYHLSQTSRFDLIQLVQDWKDIKWLLSLLKDMKIKVL